jgi:hypothetical protein
MILENASDHDPALTAFSCLIAKFCGVAPLLCMPKCIGQAAHYNVAAMKCAPRRPQLSPLHSKGEETDKTDQGAQPSSLPASTIDFLYVKLGGGDLG